MSNKKRIVIIVLLFLVTFLFIFNYYDGYSSDIDCINKTGGLVPVVDVVIFKYEAGNRELILYSDENGEFNTYTLKRHKIGQRYFYKYAGFNNLHPETYGNKWTKLNKDVKYVYTEYKRNIESIDCEGIEPLSYEIQYNIKNVGQKSCWIHIIDKSK